MSALAERSFAFVVFGPPQPKQRARRGKGGRHYTPAETRRYEQAVTQMSSLLRPREWSNDGSYRLTVAAYFADYRARDIDNVIKSVSDALNGVLYEDDNQVTQVSGFKHVDPEFPRTEIEVTWIGERAARKRKTGRVSL